MRALWYGKLIRESRLVLPPAWAVISLTLFWFLFELLACKLEGWQLAVRDPEVGFGAVMILSIGVAGFGLYRVLAFHPNLRPAYREWLRSTCWRSPQPLPLGPVTLTLGDGVWLLAMTALLWVRHPTAAAHLAVCLFATLYLMAMVHTLLTSGPRKVGYAVIFGLGGMLMTATEPGLCCLVALATYLVAWVGVRLALRDLRTIETKSFERYLGKMPTSSLALAEASSVNVGWPFGHLAPNRTSGNFGPADAACVSVLAGWLLASLMRFIAEVHGGDLNAGENLRMVVAFSFLFATILFGIRMLAFWINHRPPISWLGRLLTLRWIIPSYDRAFVSPVAAAVLLWYLAPRLLIARNPPSILLASSLLTVAMLVAFVPGPSFRRWMLTCECRIVPQKPPQPIQR